MDESGRADGLTLHECADAGATACVTRPTKSKREPSHSHIASCQSQRRARHTSALSHPRASPRRRASRRRFRPPANHAAKVAEETNGETATRSFPHRAVPLKSRLISKSLFSLQFTTCLSARVGDTRGLPISLDAVWFYCALQHNALGAFPPDSGVFPCSTHRGNRERS